MAPTQPTQVSSKDRLAVIIATAGLVGVRSARKWLRDPASVRPLTAARCQRAAAELGIVLPAAVSK